MRLVAGGWWLGWCGTDPMWRQAVHLRKVSAGVRYWTPKTETERSRSEHVAYCRV